MVNTLVIHKKLKLGIGCISKELKHYVGIGWLTHRVITKEDLTKYPRVV